MNANQVWAVGASLLSLCLSNLGCSSNSDAPDSGPSSTTRQDGGVAASGRDAATAEGGGDANPYVYAGGIGVTDLEKASAFLTQILGMTQEGPDVTRDDRVERTFWTKDLGQAPRVVLMKFNDGRNTQNITAKIVFESSDVSGVFGSAVDAGYPVILAPITLGSIFVSQVQGPEGYTVEIVNGLVDGGAEPFFIGLGFGVSDLDASVTFYKDGFGMTSTLPYDSADLVERSMVYPTGGGAGLALQHYNMTTHNYLNNPVKHVSFVPDVGAFVTKITAAGGKLVQAAAPMPAYGGKLGAVMKDPDGYIIELVQE